MKPKIPLEKAAADMRTVGGLFVALGGLPLLLALGQGMDFRVQLLMTTATLILIGPGVWYFLASKLMSRGQVWVIRITQRIGLGQMAAIVLAIAFGFIIHEEEVMVLPAILAIYFVPALIALMFQLRKVGRDPYINPGNGFAVKVISVEEKKD